MKYFFTLFFIFFFGAILKADIITVDNRDTTTAMYHDLQTAIDNAQAGDTLLIHRSTTNYGNATLGKRLVLIGEGILPSKEPLNSSSIITTLTLSYDLSKSTEASKSSIVGLAITTLNLNSRDASNQFSVDSISIAYSKINRINLTGRVYGLNITMSFINTVANGNLFNTTINNNFINSISSASVLGENNVIINNYIFGGVSFNGGIVANNIFYNQNAINIGAKNCIFSNNLFFIQDAPFVPTPLVANGNMEINSLINIDPLFVLPTTFSVTSNYTHTTPATGPFADFHLQPGSPAIAAGTDGTDLGIYGGPNPWRDGATGDSRYKYFPLPDAVPVITGVQVQNPVVNHGGNLQVEIKGTTKP